MNYLDSNRNYWEQGYAAPNVDFQVFRFYGQILKPEFELGEYTGRLVDFGCGQGAAVNFFFQHGFDARGVDMSETDVEIARTRYPHIAHRFVVCDPSPSANPYYGFTSGVSVVTAIQSLYYLSDTDLEICVGKLHKVMLPGGVFFATMMGESCSDFFQNSEPYKDGLRVVNFRNSRLDIHDYYVNFTRDEEHLVEKFKLFKPVHVGYYDAKFRSDEGNSFHYTFCGVKK